jgi:hypothetical protein
VLLTASSLLLSWKYGFPTYLDAAAFFLASKQMPDLVFILSRRCKSAVRIYFPHRPLLNLLNPAPEILSFSASSRTVTMLLQRTNLPRIEFTRQKLNFRGTKNLPASGQNRPLSFERRDRWQV